jgi:hypothetical protein
MLTVVESLFPEDVVATTLEERATVVAVAVMISPTNLGINFLHASCVTRLIARCSNVTRDLIQITWEKKRVQMMPTLMV